VNLAPLPPHRKVFEAAAHRYLTTEPSFPLARQRV